MNEQNESAALAAQVADLRVEGRELDALLSQLSDADWRRATAFKGWTIWDVVAHLHLTDHMGMSSLAGEARFRALMKDMASARAPMTAYARRWIGDISGATLRDRWRTLLEDLCAGLEATDPDVRLAWAGPGMKPRMFATARQMETWAHGSEIYDLFGAQRRETDRIRNIVTIGVGTFGWTFANRKLEAPAPAPFVRLTAPSGAVWEWNEAQTDNCVEGRAVEFCQVVTQTRNVTRVPPLHPSAVGLMAHCSATHHRRSFRRAVARYSARFSNRWLMFRILLPCELRRIPCMCWRKS